MYETMNTWSYGARPYIDIIKININRFQEPSLPLLSSKPSSYFTLLEKSPWGISGHLVQPIAKELFLFYNFKVKNHYFKSKQEFSGNTGDGGGALFESCRRAKECRMATCPSLRPDETHLYAQEWKPSALLPLLESPHQCPSPPLSGCWLNRLH